MKRLKQAVLRWKEKHWEGVSDASPEFPMGWSYPPLRLRWEWLMSDKGQWARRTAITFVLGIITGITIKSCGFN